MKQFLSVLTFFIGSLTSLFIATPAAAQECNVLGANQAKVGIVVPQSGDYRFWLNQLTSSQSNSGLALKVDENCPVNISSNNLKDSFGWIGVDENNSPLTFSLSKGSHTLIIAGGDTFNALDNGFYTTDISCQPVGSGENCLLDSVANPSASSKSSLTTPTVANKVNKTGLITFIGIWLAIFIAVIIFLKRRYHLFLGGKDMLRLESIKNFAKANKKVIIICMAILGVLLIALLLGVRVFAITNQSFEAEDAQLTGDAKVIKFEQSSSGGYVVFSNSPIAAIPPKPAPSEQQNHPGSDQSGQEDQSNNKGDDPNNDLNPVTPEGECPAFPAFPDENCTGWRHTGVSLTDCTDQTDMGYIWESDVSFDSCYFSRSLTIYGSNVKITRSQIHGVISYHWSQNYSLNNLVLEDVEIEEEGREDVGGPAVSGNNWSCLRCNVHHTVSGLHFGDNTEIRDSYTHDFQWRDEAHGAGIATGQDHGSNSRIIHNNIQCNRVDGPPICSSALSIYPEDDNGDGITLSNVQVEKNLFNATGAYCVYAVSIPGSNINFIDNMFGKKFYSGCAGYGPVTGYGPEGGLWINNVWADGSGPVVPS